MSIGEHMPKPPVVIRLSPALLAFANPWPLLLMDDPRFSYASALRMSERFLFKNDEKQFVRELLFRKSNFWIFRCDQHGFCGDFAVVDMAGKVIKKRSVYVIDLKQGAPLKIGGGGAGIQFKNAADVVASLSSSFGVVAEGAPVTLLSGDKDAILSHWGVRKA
jgi:hypothetical protein